MKNEYDFSKGKRGAVSKIPKRKKRITIRLDNDVITWFRKQVESTGKGNYQTMINDTLRDYIKAKDTKLEETIRRIISEELEKVIQKNM